MDTTVTRRNALRTGTLAALAAGLLGTVKPADAVSIAPITVGSVVDATALTAESLRLFAVVWNSHTASIAAREALAAHLTPEQDRLVSAFVDDHVGNHHGDFLDLVQAELCRHVPGLAPALSLILEHVMESTYSTFGRCCVDEPA